MPRKIGETEGFEIMKVLESFKLTGRGFVVLLQHFEQGLPKGTILQSISSGKSWIVYSRFLHIGSNVLFENETTEFAFLRFSTIEAMHDFEKKVVEQEKESAFWYIFQWQDGHEPPKAGDDLNIKDT